jgi:hypothetical protein
MLSGNFAKMTQCVRYSKSPDKKVSRSQAVMPYLMIWKQISLSQDKDVV